jgi:hypothetical protein
MAQQTGGSNGAPDGPLGTGWGFWLRWVLASIAGWAVGGLMPGLGSYRDIIVAGYAAVAVGAILTGVLQWLVLRRDVARAGGWALAGIVAVAIVGLVVFGVGVINVDIGWVLGVALFGTMVGGLQWMVLRRQVARAGWWVLASTVAWFAAMAGGALAAVDAQYGRHPVLGWVALGVVYGAITGSVLVWMLRQPLPTAWAEQ